MFVTRTHKRKWHVIAAVLAAAIILPFASAPASAANFFEKLFGVQQTPRVYAPPPVQALPAAMLPGQAAGMKIRKEKPKAKIVKAKPSEPRVRTAAVRPEVLPGPLGAFLLDPTLRRGDVVVTTDGLKVFMGQGRSQHTEGDFMALAQANRFVAGNTSVLMAIDRANRFSAKPLVEVQAVQMLRPVPAGAQSPKATLQAAIAGQGANSR